MSEKTIQYSNSDDEYGMPPLEVVVSDGDVYTVNLLISHGANVTDLSISI